MLSEYNNIARDCKELAYRGIPYSFTKVENVILINKKYYWAGTWKWRPLYRIKWYSSNGIVDFLDRFYMNFPKK